MKALGLACQRLLDFERDPLPLVGSVWVQVLDLRRFLLLDGSLPGGWLSLLRLGDAGRRHHREQYEQPRQSEKVHRTPTSDELSRRGRAPPPAPPLGATLNDDGERANRRVLRPRVGRSVRYVNDVTEDANTSPVSSLRIQFVIWRSFAR